MQENVLEIKNLSIVYPISIGTVRAVEDVSIELRKGEALGHSRLTARSGSLG